MRIRLSRCDYTDSRRLRLDKEKAPSFAGIIDQVSEGEP